MRIIISPAKKMKPDDDMPCRLSSPVFLAETERIMRWMQSLSLEQARKLWGCSEKLAQQSYTYFQDMDLYRNLTPALLSYEGIQYQYMAPAVFEDSMLSYVQKHLRILSGFYGVLRPMDGVVPYRLEMQAKAGIGEAKNLYQFWGDRIYREVVGDGQVIINLASKEYAKCVEDYLQPDDKFITCVFGEWRNGKVVQKGTYAKMARGEMVRFMAREQITEPEKIKGFTGLGYRYQTELSSDREYVFTVTF